MSKTKLILNRSSAAALLVCMSLFAPVRASASLPDSSSAQATASAQASQTASVDSPANATAQAFVRDDPVAVRNTLAREPIHAASPTLRERIDKLITLPGHAAQHDNNLAKVGLDHELVFVVPAPYGVVYESKTHELTVDADLSGDDRPGAILLAKSVKGPSGRELVIAPEAKAKGYIQHVDIIELRTQGHGKTMIHAHFPVSQAAFDKTHGAFAVELRCALMPPYLKDLREHHDPTDEEPTDITTRTSTLYVNVHSMWLINPQSGMVLTKKLHLSN
ncbi:MAG: hypothetical protein WCA85_20725 [Paraburkholderia sp.]|uniref:hypothetical protein n=1 Tax=Paraburkholderia sp. TaxID=1926495 RepID=UPI003C382906